MTTPNPMDVPDAMDRKRPKRWPALLVWLPIPLFLAAIIVLRIAEPTDAFERPRLLLLLNLTCAFLASALAIASLARMFILRGTPDLLLAACGLIAWALAGRIAVAAGMDGAGGTRFDDITIPVHNLCALLSGACQFAGAILALRSGPPIRRTGLWLAISFAAVAGLVGSIAMAATAGWTPAFFVQGEGGTPIRHAMLFSSVAFFSGAAILIGRRRWNDLSEFGAWYAPGLGLIAVGLLGVTLQRVHGGALGWVGRSAQFLSGAYLVIAGIAAVRKAGAWRASPDVALWDRRWSVWEERLMRFLAPQRSLSVPPAWRYGLAVAVVLAATALRWALIPWMGVIVPYNIALVAVVVTTLMLGIGPGLLCVALADIAVEVSVVGSLSTIPDEAMLARIGTSLGIGIFVSCIIHAIRVAHAKSRRSEAGMAAFAAATFEGIAESEAGRILDCNEQFARMVGRTVEGLKGTAIADLIAPEDRERVLASIRENRESVIEHALLRRDGARIIVEAHGRPVAPASPRRHTAVREVTERRRAEDTLGRTLDGLESVVRERTADLEQAIAHLREENEERLRTERALELEEARLEALLRLSQMSEASVAEMAGFILEHGIALTESKIGFVGFLSTALPKNVPEMAERSSCATQSAAKRHPISVTLSASSHRS